MDLDLCVFGVCIVKSWMMTELFGLLILFVEVQRARTFIVRF